MSQKLLILFLSKVILGNQRSTNKMNPCTRPDQKSTLQLSNSLRMLGTLELAVNIKKIATTITNGDSSQMGTLPL